MDQDDEDERVVRVEKDWDLNGEHGITDQKMWIWGEAWGFDCGSEFFAVITQLKVQITTFWIWTWGGMETLVLGKCRRWTRDRMGEGLC